MTAGRRFVEALLDRLSEDAVAGKPAAAFHAALLECRNGADFHDGPGTPYWDPESDPDYAAALAAAPAGDPLTEAARAVAPLTRWNPVTRAEHVRPPYDADVASRMLATLAIGSFCPVHYPTVRAGLFLLRGGLHYPLHNHESPEIYVGISGAVTISHGLNGDTHQVSPGGYSVTPSDTLHSLTTGDAPVLLAFIWLGPYDRPIWWWREDETSPTGWTRSPWHRQVDNSWAMDDEEPVVSVS